MPIARSHVLSTGRLILLGAAALWLVGDSVPRRLYAQAPATPTATLEEATIIEFASGTDSNSPAVWDLVAGRPTLHVFNSINGQPALSLGRNLLRLMTVDAVSFSTAAPGGGVWMEAVVEDDAGTWYGYYHNEVTTDRCAVADKVVPRIGAARSSDRGRTWEDLGIILEMPPELTRCQTFNHYFLGGVGDCSVMLDADKQYLYVFYSQYVERDGGVGVAVARMPWASRDEPTGQLTVWNTGAWLPAQRVEASESTEGSWTYDVSTPIYTAANRWDNADRAIDVLWGPSVHWNTFLQSYVMLLNRAVSAEFGQGGIYVAYLSDLANPKGWSTPVPLLEGGEWYPQVIGLAPGAGTDKLAGETARFYMAGRSEYVIRFGKS